MKKLFYILSVVLLMVLSIQGVSAKEAKKNVTVEFAVSPEMSCQNCENKIKKNLRFEKGVTNISTSLKEQKVSITFNPEKTDKEKLIQAFKKIGYTAYEKDTKSASVEKAGEE